MIRHFAATVAAWALLTSPTHAIVINQLDDFEGGTVLSWAGAFSAPQAPENIITGGPLGANDNFLRIGTTGLTGGAGSRMITYNGNQWTGDYTSAGVLAIEMDLKNFWTNAMSIRIALKTGAGNTPGYVSNPFTLNADGAWHHASFSLSAINFTAVNSPPSFAALLSNMQELRIMHSTDLDVLGDITFPTATFLGIDNIQASGVPEPGSLALLAFAGVVGARRWARRRSA